MKIDVDGYLSSQWEQHCRWEEEQEEKEMSIDEHAFKAWSEYSNPIGVREQLDNLSDDHFFICQEAFEDGFKAGIAHILTKGKPNE